MQSAVRRGRLGSGIRQALWALLGFGVVNALVAFALEARPELRLLERSVEGGKLAHYRQHAEDYDLVYLGTSRVFRGFDPRVFDARLAELGNPRRSYNFGLVGMGYLEALHLVTWILAQRPPGLRSLLVDPSDREVGVEYGNWFTLRDVAWHDLEATWRGLGATWDSAAGTREKLELSGLHLLSAARRLASVGLGANLLERFLTAAEPVPLVDGFGAWEATGAGREAPEARVGRKAAPAAPSSAPWETMQAIEARARAAGVRILFAIPPTTRPLAPFREAYERGLMPEFLSFSAHEVPELFENHDRYFYDQGHLNSKGAAFFSRLLADTVAAELAGE